MKEIQKEAAICPVFETLATCSFKSVLLGLALTLTPTPSCSPAHLPQGSVPSPCPAVPSVQKDISALSAHPPPVLAPEVATPHFPHTTATPSLNEKMHKVCTRSIRLLASPRFSSLHP